MKYTLLAGIIMTFSNAYCQHTSVDYKQQLAGDWAGTFTTQEGAVKKIHFSFEDKLGTFTWTEYLRFSLQHDTIVLTSFPDKKRQTVFYFKIVQLTASNLALAAVQKLSFIPDTLRLTRTTRKNNILPATIFFSSSGCYGTCPSMLLEIDSARQVKFYGTRYTQKTGGYRGTVTAADYAIILQQINSLPLDSLKAFYKADRTDDQTRGISILYNGKAIHTGAYGDDKEPVELDILFNKLMDLYNRLELIPDKTVSTGYFEALLATGKSLQYGLPYVPRSSR